MIRQSRSFVTTVLAIVLATVMLGACDWTHTGFGPGRTNFNPSEPTLTPSTVSELRQRWTIPVSGMSSQPLIANGLVYFAEPGNRVAAVNATTGAPIWSITIDVTTVYTVFAVADGKVYATTQQGLSAFDARTGVEIWSITLLIQSTRSSPWEISAGPVMANGRVYAVGQDSRLYAYDAATGTLDWSVAPTSRTLGPTLVVANGIAYVAASDGASGPNIFAVNATTGAAIWSFTTTWEGGWVAMADDDKAYVASVTCGWGCLIQTQALDATDGTVDWEAAGSVPLAVGDGIMYRYSGAIDSATGAQRWSHNSSPTAAAIAHGVVYASKGRALGAFDGATGTELWSAPLLTGSLYVTYGRPAVANGWLYVATGDSLVAFGL